MRLFPDTYLVLIDDKKKHDLIELGHKFDYDRIKNYQRFGYALFFTPQGHTKRRKPEYLSRINCWSVEIDTMSKVKQWELIKASPLSPNMIIESKNSYHIYWFALDGTADNYKKIVADRLIPFFKGDHVTSSTSHVLRVPYLLHQKKRPFQVKIKKPYDNGVYTESEMLTAFPENLTKLNIEGQNKTLENLKLKTGRTLQNLTIEKDTGLQKLTLKRENQTKPDIFKKAEKTAYKMNNIEGLKRLSGTHWVNNERYEFSPNRDATLQIIVNGKRSGCWIRKDGSIGSHSGGSPGLFQWLNWFKKYTDREIWGIINTL